MPRKYRCPVYMEHSAALPAYWRQMAELNDWNSPTRRALESAADELEEALRQDQHDLYHDAEFADGCDICDKDYEEQNS